jgi:hypothetical protein
MGGVVSKPIKAVLGAVSGGSGSGTVTAVPPTPTFTPTAVELSQSMAASAALAEAKRRGSSATNLTGGLGLSDQPTVLKTLLGQ